MITDWTFYAVAIPAVFLLGLSKGGFNGMGALSLPMIAAGAWLIRRALAAPKPA